MDTTKRALLRNNIWVIFLISWAVAGCDERADLFEELNDPPVVNFNGTDGFTVLSDSLKTKFDLKETLKRYTISLTVFDVNDNISTVEYRHVSGNGNLYADGVEITDDKLPISENGVLRFEYEPLDFGDHIFNIIVADRFNEEANVEIKLVVFENLSPVSIYNSSVIGELSKYHYVIDASESFDRDEEYGGRIIVYEYTVEGRLFRIGNDIKYHIFPSAGAYPIRVRVQDNNGVWSSYNDQTITINN